ncbi:MAG: hypothetical protein ACHRHE_10800 [Tepidisphaerales bacterium]
MKMGPVPFILFWAMAAAGQVQISAPLEGYYRPGKFMPLRVRGAAGGQLVIQPDNGVVTRVVLSAGQQDTTVPLLMMGTNRQIRYRLEGGGGGFADAELRPLGEDQKLVGFVGTPDVPLARAMFPDASIIPLKLSGPAALSGTAAAWNTLDALVLDGATPGDVRIGEFLAAGITVVVRSADKPAGQWPWKQSGGCWVLRADLLGPVMAGENQPALAPVSGWEADWPAPFRRRVLLYGTVFVVLALGAALLPRRWAVVAIIVVSAGMTLAVRAWAKGHPVVLRKTGTVLVRSEPGQTDRWTYLAASNPGPAAVAFEGCTLPLFQGPHWPLLGMTLVCDSGGLPRMYEMDMRPGVKVAFVSRGCGARAGNAPLAADGAAQAPCPLDRLADRAYLRPGWRVAGKLPANGGSIYTEDWGTVVVERTRAGPESK